MDASKGISTQGDTIKLNGERIRLTCIDAPEKEFYNGYERAKTIVDM
jgi:endonuclease YncB( thermonuclease family)